MAKATIKAPVDPVSQRMELLREIHSKGNNLTPADIAQAINLLITQIQLLTNK